MAQHQLHHRVLADDLDRRHQEVQEDPRRRAGGLALGVAAQDRQVALEGLVVAGVHVGLARRIQLHRGRVDDHVDPGELAELLDLLVGERGLGRAPAAEDVDVAHLALDQARQGVVGDVGGGQVLGRARQQARHVHRHVAVADHRRARGLQVEAHAPVVGVGVVPPDELGGRVAAGQVLARDPHAPVGAGAHRVDDAVVVGQHLVAHDVAPHLDVAEEAELGVRGDLVEDPRHRLDLLVVGRHAAAHEAEGRRQAVVDVDLHRQVLGVQEALGGVEAGGARADDRDAQGVVRRAEGGSWHRPPQGRADAIPPRLSLPGDAVCGRASSAKEVMRGIADEFLGPAGSGDRRDARGHHRRRARGLSHVDRPPPRRARPPAPGRWPPAPGPRGRAPRGG